MIQTTRNFEKFWQKPNQLTYRWHHFERGEEISAYETINDAKVFIILSSVKTFVFHYSKNYGSLTVLTH